LSEHGLGLLHGADRPGAGDQRRQRRLSAHRRDEQVSAERPAPVLLPAVPITADETEPHLLIEEGTGLEVRFEVAVGAVTVIEVTNPEESIG
jgi:hypothetical protein